MLHSSEKKKMVQDAAMTNDADEEGDGGCGDRSPRVYGNLCVKPIVSRGRAETLCVCVFYFFF
jgi:hypothetical protein